MPKYNLMDSQQPEFFGDTLENRDPGAETSEPVKKLTEQKELKSKPASTDSDFSEKLFTDAELSKLPGDRSQFTSISDSRTTESPKSTNLPQAPDTVIIEPPVSKVKVPAIDSSYQDLSSFESARENTWLKPLLMTMGIAAVLIVLALIVWKVILPGKEEVTVAVETAAEKLQRETQLRKDNFLNTLNNDTHSRLGILVQLLNLKPAKVRYSSFYLYGQTLTFEVFTANRTDLAGFNVILKNSATFAQARLEAVDRRPGTKGGLFALYDFKTGSALNPPALSAPAGTERISRNPQDWIAELSQRNSLTVVTQRSLGARQEELFSVSRHEIKLKGTEQNCQAVLTALASAQTNLGVHKLTLLPTNQRDPAKSPYQLHLILDFYL
jgi:hypothetical protein